MKKKKVLYTIGFILGFLGILGLIGTAGAVENAEAIDGQALFIRVFILLAMICAAVLCQRVGECLGGK